LYPNFLSSSFPNIINKSGTSPTASEIATIVVTERGYDYVDDSVTSVEFNAVKLYPN